MQVHPIISDEILLSYFLHIIIFGIILNGLILYIDKYY